MAHRAVCEESVGHGGGVVLVGRQEECEGSGGQGHAQHARSSARILIALMHRGLGEGPHRPIGPGPQEVGDDS